MNALKLCAVSCLVVAPVASGQMYTITDLAVGSGFDDALAYGISQNGKITGAGTVSATGELHAFIWQGGVMQDLGMLGYPYGANGLAINNGGQIAATGYGPGYQALLYSAGHVTVLGSIESGRSSEGLAINNLGHIVGRAQGDENGFQAFTYFGTFAAAPMIIARDINDSDQYVGSTAYTWVQNNYAHEVPHASMVSGGVQTDLGNLGGGQFTATEAYGINSAGQVTGYSTMADRTIHAFRYSAGVMSDLGTIAPYYTYGVSINSNGDVAGNLETYVGGQVDGFLCSHGALVSLTDLLGPRGADWSQMQVTRMNDAGWIVGYGTINGATHGFLIRPAKSLQSATPRPL
jgi:probable HAF family extracellular repeat protein